MPLNPSRTVDELRELRELTGDENGAQRVAWTDTWKRAQEWLSSKLDGQRRGGELDAAGNQWWTLAGASEQALILGGHLDSVPNGGWLDGCLNVIAGGRGAAADRRGGRAAADRTARLLGRRGGRALRPLALRLLRGRGLDGRPGRAACPAGPRRRRAARCDRARSASISTRRSTRAPSSRTRLPTSSCTSSRDRCSSRWTCRSAPCSAPSASSATGSRGAARRRTPARRRWTSGATRSPAPPSWRSSCA